MQVDSFALSVLLWEMITKDPPARGQLYTIEAPKHCPPEIVALIEKGMDRNPRKRPSARQVRPQPANPLIWRLSHSLL